MSLKSLASVHTVTVQTRSATTGASGSQAFSYSGTRQLRCRIQPAGSAEIILASQRGPEITHVAYFAEDPNLGNNDRLVFNGRNLDVAGEPTNTDELDRLWKVLVNETEHRQ